MTKHYVSAVNKFGKARDFSVLLLRSIPARLRSTQGCQQASLYHCRVFYKQVIAMAKCKNMNIWDQQIYEEGRQRKLNTTSLFPIM